MRALPIALVLSVLASPAQGQGGGCTFQVDHIGGLGQQAIVASDTNYFAGGGVQISCKGTTVTMTSDSAAFYGRGAGSIAEFIGNVKYRDSSVTMDADHGTYFRTGERWEARKHVVTSNLANGSTLVGPSLDYFRAVKGVRDTIELYAIARPTINYYPTDSTGQRGEPYVIVADRVRMRGNDRVWAAGTVHIDRSDFLARGDSLRLDTGLGSDGTLIGSPVMQGVGRDSFQLTGHRIDLKLEHQDLKYVTALGDGHAVSTDLDLRADTIGLTVEQKALVRTLAWGDSLKPVALSSDYEVRGDSVAFDTPNQHLKETRAFGLGWVGGKVDTLSRERDWMSGDTVVARFAQYDSSGATRTHLAQLESTGNARSFYRIPNAHKAGGRPSLSYSRGERITVEMKNTGDRGVARVDIRGQVDGVQLEPVEVKPDSTKADSVQTPPGAR